MGLSKSEALLKITDVRGGMNTTDEPQSLPENQVVNAQNIDWNKGTLGGKRNGCEPLDMTGSVFAKATPVLQTTVVGGQTGGTTLNLSVPPIGLDPETGMVYTVLIVKVVHTGVPITITGANFAGNAMTLVNQIASTIRVAVYWVLSPGSGGGTVALTFSAACDARAVAEVWQKTTGPSASATDSGFVYIDNLITSDPTKMVTDAVGDVRGGSPIITLVPGALQTENAQNQSGAARLATSYQIGKSDQVLMFWQGDSLSTLRSVIVTLDGADRSNWLASGSQTLALMRHTPTDDITEDELWGVDSNGRIDRRVGGVWQGGVPYLDPYSGIVQAQMPGVFDVNGVSLHGKFFLSAPTTFYATPSQTGLLVWDGTALRKAGLEPETLVLSVANTAAAGTFTSTRYYRRRNVKIVSGVVVLRSEPGAVTTFNPSGTNSGADITSSLFFDPTVYNSYGTTHFEIEASLDNQLWYRIATPAVTTYPLFAATVDTTLSSTGYGAFPQSDPIGEYVPLPAGRHLEVDEDRLIMVGDRNDETLGSRAQWTPVAGAVGAGNDERIPATTSNYLDLDNQNQGRVNAFVAGESGNIYAFKRQTIYKLTRTGVLENAYQPHTESTSRGATVRGAISGHDEQGAPAVYFTDPQVGLCRISANGVVQLGDAVEDTWVTMNTKGDGMGPRLLYWPETHHVFVMCGPVDETVNTQMLIYNTRFNAWGEWASTHLARGMYGSVLFPDTAQVMTPYVAMDQSTEIVKFTTTAIVDYQSANPAFWVPYRGYWVSRVFLFGGLYYKFGARAGVLFARRGDGVTLTLRLLRNTSLEAKEATALITGTGSQTHVMVPIDNATISECFALQLELGDNPVMSGTALEQTWRLDELALVMRLEEGGAG